MKTSNTAPPRVLVLLASSYPFGMGDPFMDAEMPYLYEAFDEVIILSNDTEAEQTRPTPSSVQVLRESYELSRTRTLGSVAGLLSPPVRAELTFARRRYGLPFSRAVLSTVLVSWARARRFAGMIASLARARPGAEVHAYSYWASDVAVAAALARKRGWVRRAYSRAHGWDVYFDRSAPGFLPFRRFLAEHLDHYLFVSEHGRRYFESLIGEGYASVGTSRLGTPELAPEPLARRAPFTVLSCGALIPLKRVELIAEALHHVRTPVRWVHLGEGPTRPLVEAVRATLPPHVRAELRGHIANDEVRHAYRALCPSLFLSVSWTEGLPVSMMEAMSAGIPVMATEVGGVGEMVEHGSNGVLLPPEPTPHQVAAELDAFAALPEAEHGRRARRALETWRAGFDAERNYSAFVHRVLARG